MTTEKKRWIYASFAALLLIGSCLRAYGLGAWPISGDEFFSVTEAHNRWDKLVNPLGYALIVLSFEMLGINEVSARLPSFLLGIITIPVFYLVVSKHRGRAVAMIATLFLVLHAWHLYQSQFARFYTGLLLFGFLSYMFFYDAVRTDDTKKYILSMLFLVVAASFQVFAILIFASFTAFSLLALVNGVPKDCVSRRLCLATSVLGVVGGFAMLPRAWSLLTHWYNSGQSWGGGPIRLTLQIFDQFGILLCCAAIFGFLLALQRERVYGIWILLLVALPVAILVVGAAFIPVRPDYIFYLLPFVLILATEFIENIGQSSSSAQLSRVGLTSIIGLSMLPQTVSYFSSKMTFDGRDAVAYVQSHRYPSDKIINFENTFKYYAPDDWIIERYQGEPFSGVVDWSSKLSGYASSSERAWIILPIRRASWDESLVDWLTCHARPVKRFVGRSFEYSEYGTSIYLKDESGPYCREQPR